MIRFKGLAKILVAIAVLFVIGSFLVSYYSFIFSRVVVGKVRSVERVTAPMAVTTQPNQNLNAQVFSFAIAIEDTKTNEIVVASSEDRQWAAVQPGTCASARYYPYPPWQVEKSGTYHNARLLKLFTNCDVLLKAQ